MNTTQNKHTPLVYYTHEDAGNGGKPVIRFAEQREEMPGGQVIATVTLSGYKVGEEFSPLEWAQHITRACNSHYELVERVATLEQILHFCQRAFETGGVKKSEEALYAIRRYSLARATGKEGA